MSLGFAAVLIRMDVARANPVFRAASLIFGGVSAALILVGLGMEHRSARQAAGALKSSPGR